MGASDLAVLQDVKDWLTAANTQFGTQSDAVLSRLITSISGMMYAYMSRRVIIPATVTERYDGYGNSRILLRNYPVLSVSSLVVDGVTRTPGTYPVGSASTSPGWPPSGYFFSPWDGLIPGKPQALDAGAGCGFPRGHQNIQVIYRCGYQVSGEAATVPASSPYQVAVQAPQGPWASDAGVTYAATGAALVPVAASPGQGQYVAPVPGSENEDAATNYLFSSADQGAAILLSYGFVPDALNGACIEWVGERYRYAGRIGQKSQTVSGQTTASYDLSAVPAFIKGALDPYRNVVPSMVWD